MPPLQAFHHRGKPDTISIVLGTPLHWYRYFVKDLTAQLIPSYLHGHIIVSRFYCTLRPPLVVDFEPQPFQGKFYCEEKRKYFLDRHIAYVPVFLADHLTAEQFAARVAEARRVLDIHVTVTAEQRTMEKVVGARDATRAVKDVLADPVVKSYIEGEALRRLKTVSGIPAAGYRGHGHHKALTRVTRLVVRDVTHAIQEGTLDALIAAAPHPKGYAAVQR